MFCTILMCQSISIVFENVSCLFKQ